VILVCKVIVGRRNIIIIITMVVMAVKDPFTAVTTVQWFQETTSENR